MDLSVRSKNELLVICETLGITKCSSKPKQQLITLINAKNSMNTQENADNTQDNANKTPLSVIDLFCGCGGMSKGLTDAGLNIIAGIDIWDKAVENYNKNFEHRAICADLTKLTAEKFDELYNIENLDLLTGSPPCQSFSNAGKREIDDSRDDLFLEYVKYLDYFNPRAFMMENVMGLLSKKNAEGEKIIDIMMVQLSRNYNCIINMLYASDFEVPQNRRRVIIMGIRKDLNILPTTPAIVSARIAVGTILIAREFTDASQYLSDRAILGIENKKKESKEKGCGFGAQFLDLNKPSFCIPARYWKDGYDALVKYDDGKIRRLSILELKRIQSFPDNYILEGSKKDIIMQIGNAVACKFAYHLGKYLINKLP
jgi:DNA (cytosine-5)-methyltransferase 1